MEFILFSRTFIAVRLVSLTLCFFHMACFSLSSVFCRQQVDVSQVSFPSFMTAYYNPYGDFLCLTCRSTGSWFLFLFHHHRRTCPSMEKVGSQPTSLSSFSSLLANSVGKFRCKPHVALFIRPRIPTTRTQSFVHILLIAHVE